MNGNLHLTKSNIYFGARFMQMEKELKTSCFVYFSMFIAFMFDIPLLFNILFLLIMAYILKLTLDIQRFESVMIAAQDLMNKEEGYISDEEEIALREDFSFSHFIKYFRPYILHFIAFIICGYILLPENMFSIVTYSFLWLTNCFTSVFFFDYYRRCGGNNFKDEDIFKGGE